MQSGGTQSLGFLGRGGLSGGDGRRRDKLNHHDAAGQRRKPPDARVGCPESRLGLSLSDSTLPGLQEKKYSSSLDRVFYQKNKKKFSVLWSPAGPLLLLASAERSEAGSQSVHGLGRPFPASSRVVCLLLRHSGGPSGRQCGHPDGVTGRAVVGA